MTTELLLLDAGLRTKDRLRVLGQTNKRVLAEGLQRDLRRASTPAESLLWTHLRARRLGGFKFRRQHPHGDYILDFVCLEHALVVEADGSQHLDSRADVRRDAYLAHAGFRVLRFWNNEILQRAPCVLEAILSALTQHSAGAHHPLPGPPLEGEGEKPATAARPDRCSTPS